MRKYCAEEDLNFGEEVVFIEAGPPVVVYDDRLRDFFKWLDKRPGMTYSTIFNAVKWSQSCLVRQCDDLELNRLLNYVRQIGGIAPILDRWKNSRKGGLAVDNATDPQAKLETDAGLEKIIDLHKALLGEAVVKVSAHVCRPRPQPRLRCNNN